MLHDLLAAVKGHGGDIFIWKGSSFQVANELGLLHPCEVALMEQVLEVAAHYKKITGFCTAYDVVRVKADTKPGQRCGVYLSALAAALGPTVRNYHCTAVELERQLLSDPELPLSVVMVALQRLAPVLISLSTLVTQIEEKDVHGCQVLETVHHYTMHSAAQVKQVLRRIEQEVHAVLYHQLSHWLLHGLLLDPYQEFFITTSTTTTSNTTTTITTSTSPDITTNIGATSTHTTTTTTTVDQTSNETQQIEALSLEESESEISSPECHLKLEMLPAHIPLSVAEQILFIGEYILVFERGARKEKVDDAAGAGLCVASARSGQVLKNREEEFRGLLAALGEEEIFSITQFTHAIETIRNCVSEELWKLVVETGLLAELGDVKAVFLLGRGELFQTLVPSLTPFLQTTTQPIANFTQLFQSAGRQVLMEDSVLEKFTLSLRATPPSQATNNPSDGWWRRLRLEYHARWPLHKLFTPTAQDKYNAIFSFLLDVRRAQYRLQQLWILQTKLKRQEEGGTLQWSLRHHMSLLIDNIQYYLQVDVLESQHWQLVREVGRTRDYQQLVTAHHNFLASVAAQCFLHHPVVRRALHQLLGLVHRFCTYLEASSSQRDGGAVREEMEKLHGELERVAAQLFFVLSNLRLHRDAQQHTSQLIMRIDYNRYYSRHSTLRRFRSPLEEEA